MRGPSQFNREYKLVLRPTHQFAISKHFEHPYKYREVGMTTGISRGEVSGA